jgi:cobalt-zinc-cadmium efflux system membrane fusion protein
MLATAQIERPMGPGVTVPATSVALRGTQHVVYLQTEPGVFERREVSLSYQGSKEVVVAQGVSPGNLVVADNLLLLARAFRLAEDETKRPASGPEPRTQP